MLFQENGLALTFTWQNEPKYTLLDSFSTKRKQNFFLPKQTTTKKTMNLVHQDLSLKLTKDLTQCTIFKEEKSGKTLAAHRISR